MGKARTPVPPRGPRARPTQRPRPNLRLPATSPALLVGGVAALGAVLLAGFFLAIRGGSSDPTGALTAAGCAPRTFPDQGANHVTELPKDFEYNSFPPTSGFHAPRPAIWGDYDDVVDQMALVHNLEHGGVVVQYGNDVAQAAIDQIGLWYADSPNGLVVARLPRLGSRIALTAWTRAAICTRFDEEAFDAFRGAYRFKGPERFPSSSLLPGT